jgi:hypothetical protein
VLRQRIIQQTSGAAKTGEPIILDALIQEVEPYTLLPSEMDFTQSGAVVRDRILMAYGVNPIVLGWTENANRASATVADEGFCFGKCAPVCRMIGDALTNFFRVVMNDRTFASGSTRRSPATRIPRAPTRNSSSGRVASRWTRCASGTGCPRCRTGQAPRWFGRHPGASNTPRRPARRTGTTARVRRRPR